LKSDSEKWKHCLCWKEWSPNSKGPLFESDNFALPNTMPDVEEPLWVTSRREFLKQQPVSERNILLTNQEFDPYANVWIYTKSDIAVQNLAILQNF
jgi:hypothetical protein